MKQYQKGIIHLAVIVVVVVIGLGAVLYFVFTNKSTQEPGALNIPGLTQKAKESDFGFIEDVLVRKHYTAQANVGSYRTKLNTGSLPGSQGVSYTEVQASAETYNHYNWQEKEDKRVGEIITLGDTVYVKDYSDGKWWKETLKPEELEQAEDLRELKPENPSDFAEMPKITHKKLGEESCGNLVCYKYEERLEDANTARTIWFDKDEFLSRRDEVSMGGLKVINEYSYDSINIKAPSPTKDVPAGKSVYDYLYGQATDDSLEYGSSDDNNLDYSVPSDFNLEDYYPEE